MDCRLPTGRAPQAWWRRSSPQTGQSYVYTRCYGRYLDFLRRRGLLSTCGPVAANVTPENVDAYIAELKASVSSVSVYDSILSAP
jgi:hypothetical protein